MKQGEGSPLTSWDYQLALRIAGVGSYIEIEVVEDRTVIVENINESIIRSAITERRIKLLIHMDTKNMSVETKVIKNDLYQKLSSEAKEIIRIIINAPSEIFKIMTPKTGQVTNRSVSKFISKYFFNRTVPGKQTKRIMNELKNFVREF